MAKYRLYLVSRRNWQDCEIVQKGFVNLGKRKVYNLHGVADNGNKAVNNVAKDVWDRFDVPIIEHEVRRRDKRDAWEKNLEPRTKWKGPIPKSRRKIQNEEIEKWLAENYGIDLEHLSEDNNKNSLFD